MFSDVRTRDIRNNSPYCFDFLTITATAGERDIENALINQIRDFLLELGQGFAFVGNQYHLNIGGDDFYIDCLFYNFKLKCFVVIELKTGKFKPEYAGQLNFYLTAIDREVKSADDSSTISAAEDPKSTVIPADSNSGI